MEMVAEKGSIATAKKRNALLGFLFFGQRGRERARGRRTDEGSGRQSGSAGSRITEESPDSGVGEQVKRPKRTSLLYCGRDVLCERI